MTCEEVRELLPGYVGGELRVADEVDAHLSVCESCRAELDAYRRMVSDLSALRESGPVPAADLVARVAALIPMPSLTGRVRLSMLEHPVLYALALAGGVAAVGAAAVVARRTQRAPATAPTHTRPERT